MTLKHSHFTPQRLPVSHSAATVPRWDAACQDALSRAPVKRGEHEGEGWGVGWVGVDLTRLSPLKKRAYLDRCVTEKSSARTYPTTVLFTDGISEDQHLKKQSAVDGFIVLIFTFSLVDKIKEKVKQSLKCFLKLFAL